MAQVLSPLFNSWHCSACLKRGGPSFWPVLSWPVMIFLRALLRTLLRVACVVVLPFGRAASIRGQDSAAVRCRGADQSKRWRSEVIQGLLDVCYAKSPPKRAPGEKLISLPWRTWWSFRKLRGWQILSLIFLGKKKKICHQKSTGFFTRLGGV